MRFSFLFKALTVLAVSGCASTPPTAESPQTLCGDARPQVCTMIYAPVCALHDDGHSETHASACNACADSSVRAHTPGPCADDRSAM